ncbi:MAG: hypothetical protein EZS28_002471 [Streblomastix strix]|uniref:Uncharacterized protein n=1 Tax=Streblomastix strix TaxID=222440 RepID=A0A5J4X437_9EUKA|nr:MAG: hypothetical protein EZS28_002471 [Streblomastix strix]
MRARSNFNGSKTATTALADEIKQDTQHYNCNVVIKFWLGFSTACGLFQQIAICRDNTKLWETSIYAREQAIICSNSLFDLIVNNSVTVSPLQCIVQCKRHCGVFIDIPCDNIDAKGENFYYRIHDPITFSRILDLNQLNPIFNEFPVLTRNYASLYPQLWITDLLQDLKVVWLNKSRYIYDQYLAYTMILPKKPDIITLQDDSGDVSYNYYSVRLINCKDLDDAATDPKNSIQQLDNAFFEYLSIHNLYFNMENKMAIIDMIRAQKVIYFPTQELKSQSSNYPIARFEPISGQIQSIMSFFNIKAMIMTFATQQYPTWFFPMLFHNMDLIIDQRHAVPSSMKLILKLLMVQFKTYYPNKYMLAWKLATDDSFIRGYNNTRIGIVDNYKIGDDNLIPENQNTLAEFMGTRSYPMCWQTGQTPMLHFLCDSIIRIMFDDNPEQQVLNLEVIGEIGGSMITAG